MEPQSLVERNPSRLARDLEIGVQVHSLGDKFTPLWTEINGTLREF
jgi:hypothetical protein